MAFTLKVNMGPLKGQSFKVTAGLQFGRRQGQVRLSDPKVSGFHAEVLEQNGDFILVDQGSKNGIRIGTERRDSITLRHGLVFGIGDSFFEVVKEHETPIEQEEGEEEITQTKGGLTRAARAGPQVKSGAQARSATEISRTLRVDLPEDAAQVERKTWSQRLTEWAIDHRTSFPNRSRVIAPFSKALSLSFIQGLQVDTTWNLGYGPRVAGPESLDCPIFEPKAPNPCFELFPTLNGVRFKTDFPETVLLNGNSIESEELKQGDQIKILNTVIEIEFLDG